jgi:hypothetical protein
VQEVCQQAHSLGSKRQKVGRCSAVGNCCEPERASVCQGPRVITPASRASSTGGTSGNFLSRRLYLFALTLAYF